MPVWEDLLRNPTQPPAGDNLDEWFGRIAERLINGSTWILGPEPHRIMEIEFYYCGDGHPDTFAHRDPLQLECGRWYFHRSGGVYRSGSFKGIDLTFGDGTAHGGVLIRGIEAADGTLIDGPSLTVDTLLDKSGATGVALLDNAVGKREAWEAGNPLLLREEAGLPARTILRTARVGLSLKRSKQAPEPPRYIMRAYRYLADPRRTAKGKVHMVLALHAQGVPPDEIQKQTGCPRPAAARLRTILRQGPVAEGPVSVARGLARQLRRPVGAELGSTPDSARMTAFRDVKLTERAGQMGLVVRLLEARDTRCQSTRSRRWT